MQITGFLQISATPGVEYHRFFRWKMPFAVFRSGSGVSDFSKAERKMSLKFSKVALNQAFGQDIPRSSEGYSENSRRLWLSEIPYWKGFPGLVTRDFSPQARVSQGLSAVGISFVPCNRRDTRRSLAIFDHKENRPS